MAQPFDMQEKAHWLHSIHARPSSAVIILEDGDERVMIVKANYKEHWTFPGGMIDEGETPKQAAVREIAEEVGLTINQQQLQFGWVVVRHSAIADTYQFIFKAPLPTDFADTISLQAEEIDEWRLVSKADVQSNDLHYAKTVQLWADGNAEGYIEQTFSRLDI